MPERWSTKLTFYRSSRQSKHGAVPSSITSSVRRSFQNSDAAYSRILRRPWPQRDDYLTHSSRSHEQRIREAGMTATKAGTAFAAFYDTEYGIDITEAQLASAWSDIATSLTNFFEIAHLSKALSTAAVLVPQRTLMFDRFGTRIVARPDLIGFRATKPPFIVDWKVQTSAPRDYRHQLATYAMALQHCKPHVDFPASGQSATSISLVEVQLRCSLENCTFIASTTTILKTSTTTSVSQPHK